MVISLSYQELFDRMRAVSHREVASILDVEARYRAEAGSEKSDDLMRCLLDASSRLASRLSRFLRDCDVRYITNTPNAPEAFVYDLAIAERRSVNKAEALEEACNTFILEYALSKFYSIVSQGELSTKHSLAALDAGNLVDELIYTKHPPIV